MSPRKIISVFAIMIAISLSLIAASAASAKSQSTDISFSGIIIDQNDHIGTLTRGGQYHFYFQGSNDDRHRPLINVIVTLTGTDSDPAPAVIGKVTSGNGFSGMFAFTAPASGDSYQITLTLTANGNRSETLSYSGSLVAPGV